MKELDKILNEKIKERETKEKDFQERTESESRRKEKEYFERKEFERITRNKASVKFAFNDALIYGLIGTIIGAILGFGKGCVNYHPGNSPLSEPFWYIPERALTVCIIGVIIGVFIGIIRGQLKRTDK